MVQKSDKEHEPSPIHIIRDIRGIVDGKTLVAHPEDQVELLPAQSPELIKHGDPVKQMSGIDHQCHGKRLQWIERSEKHIDRNKFYGSGKDRDAHQHGIPEAEAGHIHIDPVCNSKKPETGKDRYCIRKGRLKCLFQFL